MNDQAWWIESAGFLWMITWAFMALVFLYTIFLQWMVFQKAGYSGALALINLAIFIPIIGIFAVLGLQTWFAFAAWPALRSAQPPIAFGSAPPA